MKFFFYKFHFIHSSILRNSTVNVVGKKVSTTSWALNHLWFFFAVSSLLLFAFLIEMRERLSIYWSHWQITIFAIFRFIFQSKFIYHNLNSTIIIIIEVWVLCNLICVRIRRFTFPACRCILDINFYFWNEVSFSVQREILMLVMRPVKLSDQYTIKLSNTFN